MKLVPRDTEVRFLTYEAAGLFVVPAGDANFAGYDPISGTNKNIINSDGYYERIEQQCAQKAV